MPTTYYYTVDSEIIGEHTAGQSRIDYLTDALGSVVTTVDQSQTVTSTARFKPFGSDLATTGTVPINAWKGSRGYRRTGRPHATEYVRARHLGTSGGTWIALDPLWPRQPGYQYVRNNPITYIDPTGLISILPKGWPAGWRTSEDNSMGRTGCGDCGFASWFIYWNLIAPTYPDTSGYIIQHIRAVRHCSTCEGHPCGGLNGDVFVDQYEAFRVDFYPSKGDYEAHGDEYDKWQFGGNVTCSKGTLSIYSHMRYYPGLTEDDMKTLGFDGTGCQATGALRFCRLGAPPGWTDQRPKRKLTYSWDCCGHNKDCSQNCLPSDPAFDVSPRNYLNRTQ